MIGNFFLIFFSIVFHGIEFPFQQCGFQVVINFMYVKVYDESFVSFLICF